MKKLILTLAIALCAITANAQYSGASVGLRWGSGLHAVAEFKFSDMGYLEERIGMDYCRPGAWVTFDEVTLWNFNCLNMDWTPSAGEWFLDAGAGLALGGRANYVEVGAAGCVKLGINFHSAPVRLSIDWTPKIGAGIAVGGGMCVADFNRYGLANFGISAVYCF